MKNDLAMYATAVKDSVSCKTVLEANGITVSRHGFAVCPLHGDSDASLKVYDNGRGWCCYGCHKGGDVINLARYLYGVGFGDAIRRLNADFNLGLDVDGKPSKKDALTWKVNALREKYKRQEAEKAKQKAEKEYLDSVSIYLKLRDIVEELQPDPDAEWPPAFRIYLKLRESAKMRMDNKYWEWVAYER